MNSINSILIGGKQIGVQCLRALIARDEAPQLVIANSEDTGDDTWHESLVRVARESGLEVLQGKKVKEPNVVAEIASRKPEIIFCFGGMEIIPKDVLAIPPRGTLNLHPALLPKYRGRYSIPHAIFNGETETGVTLHFLDEGIDSGPIIAQKAYPIGDDDTAKIAYDSFTRVGTELFEEFLESFMRDREISSKPQNEADATYYPKGLPNDGEIDWSWDGATIRRFIRAMTFEPFPPASFRLGEKTMVIADKDGFTGGSPSDRKN